ncbi:TfoX/Sxy family protein [Hyphobacterium sp. HN65]|uniref:TfoX/Sxy family protein n=1 Tax=Hyphobacterium lacteum TaxID=3116575 RepID=A0ABU7LN81_9PROT|nr:TfoX/Sxy family protein [Hyphobacterium sp. HN65]MEE2525362.1 TfoX/Sxy family protein [Hyphobacterium sp. HN65]
MAFDPDLADRMETALRGLGADPVRKPMFGGIAFMIEGHMAFGTLRDEIHVRVGLDAYEETLAHPDAGPMDMTGRVMTGWVTIEGAADLSEAALSEWAEKAFAFVRTLPPKKQA